MSTFVLIHGAWHGAWCWYKLIPLLQDRGHKVLAPDLPALGIDRTPLESASLKSYVERVAETLERCDEPVHLVGHSMGGIVITQSAEALPEKIASLTYLAAFLLPDGRSLLEEVHTDEHSEVAPNLILSADKKSATLRPEALVSAFYADCSAADQTLAKTLLVPQATAPLATPVRTTAQRWGQIPRRYIECADDHALCLTAQRAMHNRLPCQNFQ